MFGLISRLEVIKALTLATKAQRHKGAKAERRRGGGGWEMAGGERLVLATRGSWSFRRWGSQAGAWEPAKFPYGLPIRHRKQGLKMALKWTLFGTLDN